MNVMNLYFIEKVFRVSNLFIFCKNVVVFCIKFYIHNEIFLSLKNMKRRGLSIEAKNKIKDLHLCIKNVGC